MKKTLTVLAFLAVIPTGMALAGDDCSVPLANWQPREAVTQMAQDKGWILRRIKIDDGCYEVKGTDATGREIKAKIDPATLRVIKLKYKDSDKDRRSRDRKEGANRTTPLVAPRSPLFRNGALPQVQVK